MPWSQAGAAVVVAAHQFNPSVTSQLWLVRNGFVGENDFLPGCVFTDMFVQVRSTQFHMLVIPDQLQFVPTVPPAEEQRLIMDKVGAVARTLPHTPFRAIGLNFNWHLIPVEGDLHRITRALFFREQTPLFQHFAADDAHFGGYLSKNTFGFRLKPILVQAADHPEGRVQFAFNFHAELGENAVQQIENHLLRWNEVRQEAERIINSVELRD